LFVVDRDTFFFPVPLCFCLLSLLIFKLFPSFLRPILIQSLIVKMMALKLTFVTFVLGYSAICVKAGHHGGGGFGGFGGGGGGHFGFPIGRGHATLPAIVKHHGPPQLPPPQFFVKTEPTHGHGASFPVLLKGGGGGGGHGGGSFPIFFNGGHGGPIGGPVLIKGGHGGHGGHGGKGEHHAVSGPSYLITTVHHVQKVSPGGKLLASFGGHGHGHGHGGHGHGHGGHGHGHGGHGHGGHGPYIGGEGHTKIILAKGGW